MRFSPFWRDIFQSVIDGEWSSLLFYMSQVLLAMSERAKERGEERRRWENVDGVLVSLFELYQVEIKYVKHARILPLPLSTAFFRRVYQLHFCSPSPLWSLLIFTSRLLFFSSLFRQHSAFAAPSIGEKPLSFADRRCITFGCDFTQRD